MRNGSGKNALGLHSALSSIYHMLSQQVSYNDLGDLYLDKLNKSHLTHKPGPIVCNVWGTSFR